MTKFEQYKKYPLTRDPYYAPEFGEDDAEHLLSIMLDNHRDELVCSILSSMIHGANDNEFSELVQNVMRDINKKILDSEKQSNYD